MKYAIINNTTIENIIELTEFEQIPENAYPVTEQNLNLWIEYINFTKYFPIQTDENLTQFDIDKIKYMKRASVKNSLLAEMATENMERVRSGIWTVQDLINLTQDSDLKLALDDINTLSFELAQSKILAAPNSLLTTEIKNSWILKLQNNLFN